MKSKKNGFTLVELIVVIAIISVLMGILLGSFQKIHMQSLNLSCRMNMHQLSKGFHFYAMEYSGYLPHSDRDSDTGKNFCWFDVLDPYMLTSNLNKVKQCSMWSGANTLGDTIDEHSIKMNGGLCSKERLPQTPDDTKNNLWYWPNVSRIKEKSKTVLLVDGTMEKPFHQHTDTRSTKPYKDIANRHNGGANILFVDGTAIFVNAKKHKIATGEVGWSDHYNLIWEPWK